MTPHVLDSEIAAENARMKTAIRTLIGIIRRLATARSEFYRRELVAELVQVADEIEEALR
jgi:hypothetical protein